MPHMLVRAKYEDYDRFRSVFDERASTRKDHGSLGARVFRNASDPAEVVVLLEWSDLAKAREFSQSDTLREGMQLAGVMGRPDVYFLEEAGSTTA
jgi:heme-degrading monooxygenase HmoA